MRRVVFGLCVTLFLTCRLAQAASISLAGADCGTDPLLGLTFTTLTGTSAALNSAGCPTGGFGLGSIVNGSGGSLYGPVVNSIEFSISDRAQFTDNPLTVLYTSAIGAGEGGLLVYTETGFRLSGGPGIFAPCTFVGVTYDGPCGYRDALITFSGFAAGTEFTVVAVNGISAVPEPGTLGLLLTGVGAAIVSRRRRGRSRQAG